MKQEETSSPQALSGSPFEGYACTGGCGRPVMPGDHVVEIRQGIRAPDGIAFERFTSHDFWHEGCWDGGAAKCSECGCTQDAGCDGGCVTITPGVCSQCASDDDLRAAVEILTQEFQHRLDEHQHEVFLEHVDDDDHTPWFGEGEPYADH
jgi:hypothetical protein